jgi:IclR family transcriptional regulator, KDG regulon repressor
LNSIEKALEILHVFTPDNRPLRSVEISHRLKMNKATVNRILITLKKRGFVVQDDASRRYRLGPSTALLGRAVKQSLNGRLVALAKPYLDSLRDKVGETVHLEVLTGGRIFLSYSATGIRQVTVTPRVGDQMAINANAGAKAIMAFSSQEEIEKGLAGRLKKFTSKTVVALGKIRKEYEEIRTNGFAYDKEEFDEDVHAVAAPIFNYEDRVVAAVVIIAPSFRMNNSIETGSLELLKDTANEISDRLSKL